MVNPFSDSLGHPSTSAHFASATDPGAITSDSTRVRSEPPTLSCAFRHFLHTLVKMNRQLPSRFRLAITSWIFSSVQ